MPAIRILPPTGPEPRFSVRERRPIPAETAARIDAEWTRLCESGARLYDGPILLVDMAALDAGRLMCTRDTYRTLAGAAASGPLTRALGVQGVVLGCDAAGAEHMLLGRRSTQTRIYGGLWENAPSGSVAPPADGSQTISLDHFVAALRDEGLEELGIDLADSDTRWLGLLEDPEAFSTDIVLKLRPRRPINPRNRPCAAGDQGRWEYIDTAWVPLDALSAWITGHAAAVSPPTRALIEHLLSKKPDWA